MNRQSLEFGRGKLPRYGDPEECYERGVRYVFAKKEHMTEPLDKTRAVRKFDSLGHALEWARNNMGADQFLIVSI